MSPRFPLRPRFAAFVFASALALPLPVSAGSELLAMRVELPADAAIADVSAHAGETSDLCAPGEQLRHEGDGWVCELRGVRIAGRQTYQTFELASVRPGARTRFAAPCLGREDRVIGGTCVRRAAGGYVSFAGRATTAGGSEAVECALDGSESPAAVGIAICLDLPPLR